MAFNFNWAPLTTPNTSSSDFYLHAKSLLTAALNKSQKPPIIVDDIFVEELNLGKSAPELEILEIGELEEDSFRGNFRMSYDGDASLTLKTKLQANPLNTYLSTTPAFTSPMPLAASSPLTIPLQITLSQFRLSGFIILAFSKAKGITLVFRNDPLESLKVSSTFDTIPFIKDYLQKEIERQVRGLFQEELPVAIHKLSLRLWNPEYAASLGLDTQDAGPTPPTDGLGGCLAGASAATFIGQLLSAGGGSDAPSIAFSQNLAALRSLSESQRSLGIFTPSISVAVFRAWVSGGGNSMIWDRSGSVESPGTPMGGPQTYTFSDTGEAISGGTGLPSGSGLSSPNSSISPSGVATSGGRSRGRKGKHRIVNLRSTKGAPIPAEPPSSSHPAEEPTTEIKLEEEPPSPRTQSFTTIPANLSQPMEGKIVFESPTSRPTAMENFALSPTSPSGLSDKPRTHTRAGSAYTSAILEKAFMMKLAGEMQKGLDEERKKRGITAGSGRMWGEIERELRELARNPEAPPAYRQ